MDLPSHVLYTYAFEKIATRTIAKNSSYFVSSSLIFAALPDILESTPFLVYLYMNRNKYHLKGIRSVINFAADITHNRPEEYEKTFRCFSKISFYTHSYLVYILTAAFLYLFFNFLFLPFVIGYGFHLLTDMFMHNDYFSSRPFYPISNYKISGLCTWYKKKNFTIWNYGILFVIYVIMFLFL